MIRTVDQSITKHCVGKEWREGATTLRVANKSLPESYFFEYLEDTYATTQAVAVRRQAEARSRVVTLGQLVTEIRDEAKGLTRKFWVGLWDNSDAKRIGVPDAALPSSSHPTGGITWIRPSPMRTCRG